MKFISHEYAHEVAICEKLTPQKYFAIQIQYCHRIVIQSPFLHENALFALNPSSNLASNY